MIRWMVAVALCLCSTAALAEDIMPAPEREAYLEACLVVTQAAPELTGTQRLGTGAVTRGHASVALFDVQKGHAVELDCTFAVLEGRVPVATQLVLTQADGTSHTLDLAASNAAIAGRMQ